ncbi:MAG: hypothetical protein K8S14_00465 [Actinomycetia bacterium]|nr:hypothetical protein [Actinomycetes bacterium]
MRYKAYQRMVIEAPLAGRVFLAGPAGTGKTTAGVARLRYWLAAGVSAGRVLVLAPQRTLAAPYDEVRHDPALPPGGEVAVATVGGIARRMIDLFWPLLAAKVDFGQPLARPTFLTLETAQYFMAQVVAPLVADEGYFDALVIDRNRLYSQILDNLNKAAVVGFPLTEIALRLKEAWSGEQRQQRSYDEAQECAVRFRRYCREHNLLDFSFQLELFIQQLWPEPLVREYLREQYTHLIVDNVEEDTPVAHDLLREWLPDFSAALLIYDEGAGQRVFLGADPVSGVALQEVCDEVLHFTESLVMSPGVAACGAALGQALERSHASRAPVLAKRPAPGAQQASIALRYGVRRFYPQMLDWVAETVAGLVHDEGVPPAEIVVLAPFLTDLLRFSLVHRLTALEVPTRSHRPSRALRDEPATQTLLTLAALAHPQWGRAPACDDVAYALRQAIAGLDLVRAQLLAEILDKVRAGAPALSSFDSLKSEVQQRITYVLGGRYEALRTWLAAYSSAAENVELDHFLARLFGELLSQPGLGFHADFEAARVVANVIESVQKFRRIAAGYDPGVVGESTSPWGAKSLGQEYVEMVEAGVVAAQYVRNWEAEEDDEAVLLAPAYTFLMRNRPVDYQFWLNVGGRGWWERLYQPLTQPYVLSRRWERGRQWGHADEMAARQQALERLTRGLVWRCRQGIFLGLSELGAYGYEQRGPLLQALQRLLREQLQVEGCRLKVAG